MCRQEQLAHPTIPASRDLDPAAASPALPPPQQTHTSQALLLLLALRAKCHDGSSTASELGSSPHAPCCGYHCQVGLTQGRVPKHMPATKHKTHTDTHTGCYVGLLSCNLIQSKCINTHIHTQLLLPWEYPSRQAALCAATPPIRWPATGTIPPSVQGRTASTLVR